MTNLAYPVGDLGLLALIVAAITVTGWKNAGAWRWIALAFSIFAAADSTYLIQTANETYVAGGILDLGWSAAALVMGFAAWRPETRLRSGTRLGQTSVLPALFGVGALGLLVVDHYVPTNPLALTLATASILVVFVRLYLTVLDNAQMLRHSRHEAATDALIGQGNRRRLTDDLAARVEDLDPRRPLMLTLFDLDGFKYYNDTFGHPAGDQLLQRLSSRLDEAVAGHGTAYRMGGDESCALSNLTDVDAATATAQEATAALSDHGEGFAIGCSHGSVLLPTETTDPTEALRIADRRMYVLKGTGRASAGRQSSDVLLRALSERDSELGVHLGGVAELACATAPRLGIRSEDLETVR